MKLSRIILLLFGAIACVYLFLVILTQVLRVINYYLERWLD